MSNGPFREPAADRLEDPASEPPESEAASDARPEHALIDATATNTAVMQANFTVSGEERMRVLVSGPPAYMRRRREIEDLEASICAALRAVEEGRARDTDLVRMRLEKQVVRLNALIELHNRYYPSEANLPIDPTTGGLLEMGDPWIPLELRTLDALRLVARRR